MVKSESVNRIRPVNKMTKRKRQIDKPRITTQKRLTNTNPQKGRSTWVLSEGNHFLSTSCYRCVTGK